MLELFVLAAAAFRLGGGGAGGAVEEVKRSALRLRVLVGGGGGGGGEMGSDFRGFEGGSLEVEGEGSTREGGGGGDGLDRRWTGGAGTPKSLTFDDGVSDFVVGFERAWTEDRSGLGGELTGGAESCWEVEAAGERVEIGFEAGGSERGSAGVAVGDRTRFFHWIVGMGSV